jgi:hypothetical protein
MPTQIQILKQIVESVISSLKSAQTILNELDTGEGITEEQKRKPILKEETQIPGEIIEGVFDGQNMIGHDGKKYSVPANYASKSKLIEGDKLKLTITPTGVFVYKQIGPYERKRLKGVLFRDEKTAEWQVLAEDKLYKILMASVTYFKGGVGDEVIILVPKDKESTWAACENIIKKLEEPKLESNLLEKENVPTEIPKEIESGGSPAIEQRETEQMLEEI